MSEPATSEQISAVSASKPRQIRLAIPLTILALYWIAFIAISTLNLAIFQVFLYRMAATLALLAAFTLWWFFNRGVSWGEKFLLPAIAVAGLLLAHFARSPEVEPKPVVSLMMFILAAAFTLATLWILLTRHATARARRGGLIAIALLMWAPIALIRTSGMSGGALPEMHWRWTPSGEEEFLAARQQQKAATAGRDAKLAEPIVASETDWTAFRGPNRDAVLHGVKLATDWEKSPPQELWRQRIGPGWSSITAVGNLLFTQEQRGDIEAVIALDAATGKEVWSYEDKTRFS